MNEIPDGHRVDFVGVGRAVMWTQTHGGPWPASQRLATYA